MLKTRMNLPRQPGLVNRLKAFFSRDSRNLSGTEAPHQTVIEARTLTIAILVGTGISAARAAEGAEAQSIVVFFKQQDFAQEPDASAIAVYMESLGWRAVSIKPSGVMKYENEKGLLTLSGDAARDSGLKEAHDKGIAIFVFPQKT